MTYYYNIISPLGLLTVSGDKENVTGLWMENQKYFAATLENDASEKNIPLFEEVKKWLDDYFDGKRVAMTLPLAPKGSEFRQSIWKILCDIPYGEVTTYGSIAKLYERLYPGKKASAQAVGGAVGHNPISIIIPCHRVVGANGNLTGYAGGVEKKLRLLTLEGAKVENLYIPTKGTAL